MGLTTVACALGVLAFCGCGSHAPPPAPADRLPPAVVAVFPPARSTRVGQDTGIWVEFKSALDPASVTDRTVSLLNDARAIPATVTWDAVAQRIRIAPHAALGIRLTYTVELSPAVKTADGTPLGGTYFWQFTTTSVRPFGAPTPGDGAIDQGPFVGLLWTGTEPSAGDIVYDLFSGLDSARVAARLDPARVRTTSPRLLRPERRALGATYYWLVRVTNLSTGEGLDSPVWRFSTVPADAPVDSLIAAISDWGVGVGGSVPRTVCAGEYMDGTGRTAVRWALDGLHLRLADARMIFSIRFGTGGTGSAALYEALEPWAGCRVGLQGPPQVSSEELAPSVGGEAGLRYVYLESDVLTAEVQSHTYAPSYGYVVRGPATYASPFNENPVFQPTLVLIYYRDPPAAAGLRRARPMPGR